MYKNQFVGRPPPPLPPALRAGGRGGGKSGGLSGGAGKIKKTGRRAAPFGYWVSGCGETVRFRPSCRRMGSIILR